MKRNSVKSITAFILAVILVFGCATALADNLLTVRITLSYQYSTARSMLKMINDFRTGDTWKWEENGTKTYIHGLSALTYDYGLERMGG